MKNKLLNFMALLIAVFCFADFATDANAATNIPTGKTNISMEKLDDSNPVVVIIGLPHSAPSAAMAKALAIADRQHLTIFTGSHLELTRERDFADDKSITSEITGKAPAFLSEQIINRKFSLIDRPPVETSRLMPSVKSDRRILKHPFLKRPFQNGTNIKYRR